MKVQFACLSVGVALAAGTMPAAAADWGNGSRGGGYPNAAVAVPAPVPIPEYKPSWYFRFDAALGIVNDPDVSESGFAYGDLIGGDNGTPGAGGPTLRNSDSSWFETDFDTFLTLGGGVGYYFGNGWRMDATIEKRSKDDTAGNGADSWESHSYYDHDGNPATANIYDTDRDGDIDGDGLVEADRQTNLQFTDKATVAGTIWMLNGYYDIMSSRGFTPYIGAGLGFVWNEISRETQVNITQCALEDPCGGTSTVASYSNSTRAESVSFAAAAMVGFTYDVSDMTSVDLGYRYLYLAGTSAAFDINGYESRLNIGDQSVHQMRAGLRFNVN